jgi:hypothetical protein
MHLTATHILRAIRTGLSRCRQTRMLYRGKRYIVTATFDDHWAWVVIMSSRLSVRGRTMTKFEAIEQATHLIDRMISVEPRQSLPCSRHERLRRFAFGFLKKGTAKHFRRALRSYSKLLAPVNRRLSR